MSTQDKSISLWEKHGMRSMFFVVLVLMARLISMYWIPLNDSTEARYAEMARLMLSSHNWVSLMHYPGQYFWAKPPLSTWLSAVFMNAFGISPFVARLPAMLLSFVCLGLLAKMAFVQLGRQGALWVVAILSSTIYFLLDAGTVMTDPSLLTAVVLVMSSFWLAMQPGQSKVWGYLVFVGWGLGLLAKGPVVGVFTILPLLTWLSLSRNWKACWHKLPWIKGSLLTLAIALPWYILAEQRTPGFLSYFLIGENFMRFLRPGWTGDLYGFAHQAPMGMIWIYFVLGSLPWSIVLAIWAINEKHVFRFERAELSWLIYLSSFLLLPLIFFTFARNIIYPYVFPVLPAFALLFTSLMFKTNLERRFSVVFQILSILIAMLVIGIAYSFWKFPVQISKSNDQMIAAWVKDRKSADEKLIYVLTAPEYSSMFYSSGTVLASRDEQKLCQWFKESPKYLVLDSDEPSYFDESIQQEFSMVFSVQHRHRIDRIYRIDSLPSFCEGQV